MAKSVYFLLMFSFIFPWTRSVGEDVQPLKNRCASLHFPAWAQPLMTQTKQIIQRWHRNGHSTKTPLPSRPQVRLLHRSPTARWWAVPSRGYKHRTHRRCWALVPLFLFVPPRVVQEQSSEGPPPLTLSPEVKEATLDTPSAVDELDTPTSITSAMTSTNESSTETDTPLQTDTEVRDFSFVFRVKPQSVLWQNFKMVPRRLHEDIIAILF